MRNKLTKFLTSECPPKGMRQFAKTWKYAACMLLAFILGVGQMWGAEPTHESPSIVKVANRNFLDLQHTPSNVEVSTDSYSNYGPGYFVSNKGEDLTKSWWSFSGTFKSSSSSYSNVSGAVGFHATGSSSSSEFYQIMQMREGSGRMTQMDFYVTGTTQMGFQWKNGGTSGKYLTFTIYEMDVTGVTATDVATPVSVVQGSTTSNSAQYAASAALKGAKYYHVVVTPVNTSNIDFYGLTFKHAPVDTYSVTYSPGDGSVKEGKSLPTQAAVPAGTEITLASADDLELDGKEFDGWLCSKNSTKYAAGAKYTMTADATTFTAQWRNPAPKYTITYSLNGASGDAPTETDKAAGDAFNLAAAPSWAGHAFDGWLCSADAAVKAAGSSYTMTAANTTFTAQWHEVDCKIYSLTGGIGSATAEADESNVVIDASSLVLKSSNAIIKLTSGSGTFKAGDVLTISGTVGNTSKNFGVKISASNNKGSGLGLASVAGTSNPMVATATLSADADYLYICRDGGTTQTLLTCEVHRSCAEGTAAGLSYAAAEVNKTEGDATFTNPLTNANSLVLDGYKSSNEEVATVNFSTGEVTIVGAGSATITANSAIQTKAGTLYAAGTASYTLMVAALPKYHVTYDLNGGSGDVAEVDHKAGEKFTLHDGVTGVTAPGSKTFVNWKDQDDALFDGGVEFTMPGKDVTLTAQWAGDVYTVKFMDGETVLDTKVVEVGSHPTDIEHPTKPLSSFAAWQLSGSDVVLDDVTGTKDAIVILTARWEAAYALDVNFKDAATQALGVETALNTYHYASDASDISFEAKGLKIKTNAARFYFNVAPGKVAEIKFGDISGATYSVDGGAAETLSASQLKATYSASAQSCVMTMTTAAYNIVEKITIHDPYTVSFEAHGDADPADMQGTPSVNLPTPTNGSASFLGWFDAETGGNKIGEAGASYTPTANITLHAQWEAVSTDARLASITFSAAGTLSPAFNPEVTNYTYTMPYGTAAVPTITGATKANAKGQDPVIDAQASAWGETAQVHGVAESGDTKNYYVQMLKAPKDGVCLVWADVSADNTLTYNATNSKFYAESDVTLQNSNVKGKDGSAPSGKKFQTNGFLKIALNEGTFLAGDVVALNVTYGTANVMHVFKAQAATSTDVIGEATGNTDAGLNKVAITEDAATLWLVRGGDYGDWNPHVDYVAVYRAMNPILTAITINGRDGEIDALNDHHFTVTIPSDANLASLTIVPTIVSNTAEADVVKTIESNGGAWVLTADGDNTYRIKDKDGDYTDYTITLIRDVLKYTVSFNTHGGSAIADELVVAGEKLAAAPADPTKEDYIFQGWSATDGGSIIDITDVTIDEPKTFHAVWAADGAIKLLDGATVNHTNFITGVTADETVEFMGNTVNYAKFSGTVSGVNGVKDLTRVIAYNATTNKTKIRISAHNNSTSGRSILVKGLVEGANAAVDLATIALGNKEDKVSDWIEFDNAANRTIYIFVGSSAGDVYFTQVKVIESGETPMKQAGETGYSLNLNKGRFFGLASTDLAFEGLNARLSGDYTALNSGYAKLTSTSMSFTVASAMTLSVTTNNNKTYYVTEGAAGTDNETAKTGVSEFNLTAGTWYITAGASEVQFTNIAFSAPKAAKPVVTDLANVDYCSGETIDALTVSATVSDGGTMTYQWYKDDAIIAGAEAATYQPTADGEYYVIVVNTKSGYENSDPTQSNTITVTGHAGTAISGTTGAEDWPDANVTISVTASGKNLHYAWYTCEDALGTNPVAVDPAVDAATLNVTVGAADSYYKVVVSGDCGSAQEAIITVVTRMGVPTLVDVTGDMTWDFSKDGLADQATVGTEVIMANVAGVVNDANFKSDNIKVTANKQAGTKLQASMIMFHTTVDGLIKVVFSNTGDKSSERYLVVNGKKTDSGTKTKTNITYYGFVPAGDVVLTVIEGDGNMLNFASVQFTAKAAADLARDAAHGDDWMAPGELGTVCIPNGAVATGGDLYTLEGKNSDGKIVFATVPNNRMTPGVPYLFQATSNAMKFFYTDETPATEPDNSGAMKGTFVDLDLTDLTNVYYFAGHALWSCSDLTSLEVKANRAWVDMSKVGSGANPAPGRRYIIMDVHGQNATTDVDLLNSAEAPVKMIIDGQLFILRGEKMYDATGRMVK